LIVSVGYRLRTFNMFSRTASRMTPSTRPHRQHHLHGSR